VDPITFIHRPIPADRRDHLLPDVIDRIRLTLRALPAAGHDLFRLRCLAALARNESEITHPGEGHVPRIARAVFIAPG
jgi:hypothetical protein